MRRTPYQGVTNIIRFNPNFFIAAIAVSIITIVAIMLTTGWPAIILSLGLVSVITFLVLSLTASHWIYDRSNLYKTPWLDGIRPGSTLLNINAGFDETTPIIISKFPDTHIRVIDFYDPEKHTEPSIARARKAYPPVGHTESVTNGILPAENKSISHITTILSLHEIRAHEERVCILNELHRILEDNGRLYITEHLRDIFNFSVYSIGVLHFHSKKTWIKSFEESGFQIESIHKTTPFISTFILKKK